MGPCVSNLFNRLVTFGRIQLFLDVVLVISGSSVEFVAGREIYVCLFGFVVRIGVLLEIVCLISAKSIEGRFVRVVHVIFGVRFLSRDAFGPKVNFILRAAVEGNIAGLIFDPRD